MNDPGFELTYCLNVHSGETWDAQLDAVRNHALPIRNALDPESPFGLGLRVSADAAEKLVGSPLLIEAFRDEIAASNAYVMTVNAFPFGEFHGVRVKDTVYRPDWSSAARVRYTCNVVNAVALMSSEARTVSVSTSPLTFKGWDSYDSYLDAAVRNIARCAAECFRVEKATGVEVVLCIEPEPYCYPETTPELIAVLKRIWSDGAELFSLETGVSKADAENSLRRFIGCCFDTAHQAVEFEDLADSVTALSDAGVRIGKVQLSSAIEAKGADALMELKNYSEPTYLHRTSISGVDGTLMRFSDLAEALESGRHPADAVWRVHYHTPLFISQSGALRSTSYLLQDKRFLNALSTSGCRHLEVETYTWDVWQENSGSSYNLDDGILRELRWVKNVMGI